MSDNPDGEDAQVDGAALVPEWDKLGIPEDDDAEPADAGDDHEGEA